MNGEDLEKLIKNTQSGLSGGKRRDIEALASSGEGRKVKEMLGGDEALESMLERGDAAALQKTLKNNFKQMKRFEKFADKNGIKFLPSYANFITYMLDDNRNSTEICDALLRRGIILRNLKSYGLNAIRITIGLPKQNSRIFKALKELL